MGICNAVAKIKNNETHPIISSKIVSFCLEKSFSIEQACNQPNCIFIMFLFCSHIILYLSNNN